MISTRLTLDVTTYILLNTTTSEIGSILACMACTRPVMAKCSKLTFEPYSTFAGPHRQDTGPSMLYCPNNGKGDPAWASIELIWKL
ncbi:hypothetical protein AHF37_07794 [Paragonimus kellicotti]|nr:hypothetical protein AHF37_07794 [Paragonimus kellicotti]